MQEKSFELPFDPVHPQEWLDKVDQDMKGKKTWRDFLAQWEGLELNPFYSSAEVEMPLDRLFTQILSGSKISMEVGDKDNSRILSFLEKGAEALYLKLNAIDNPENLLTGIHLDYIFSFIETKELEPASKIASYLESEYEDKSIQSFVLHDNNVIYPKQTLYLPVDVSQKTIETLVNVLRNAENAILTEKPLRCIVHFSIGKDFLMTIATLRAFRILWENLLVKIGFEEDIPLIIMASPEDTLLSQNPNQALIESSYLILSSILGNVDISFSSPVPGQDTAYDLRAFMIHQIYKEEGKLFTVKDPVAGSYFIEQATRQIAEKAWNSL